MCYMVYMSMDCAVDLTVHNSELVRFEEPSTERQCLKPRSLKYQYNWFIGSKAGCSCTFRHLCRESVELGFGHPEDWFPEEEEGIEATGLLYDIIATMIGHGCHVQLLDCWSGDEQNEAIAVNVRLSEVTKEAFRFFEGHIFEIKE
jgi:hypothetical protein